MKVLKVLFCNLLIVGVVAASSDTNYQVILPDEIGILIVSETEYFNKRGISVSQKTIMKKGNRIRIDETSPTPLDDLQEQYQEPSKVTISNGNNAWVLSPGKRETIEPIADLGEYLGFRHPTVGEKESRRACRDLPGDTIKIIKKGNKKRYIYKPNHSIIKEERGTRKVVYKNHEFIEGIGSFPRTIERYRNGKLRVRTQVRRVDLFREFSSKLFDPEQIKFSEPAEQNEVNQDKSVAIKQQKRKVIGE